MGLVAVVLAVVVMAASAGTATAAITTKLCSTPTSPFGCPAVDVYPAGTTFKSEFIESQFETNRGNILCGSSIEGQSEAVVGVPELPIAIPVQLLEGCDLEGVTPCSSFVENLPWEAQLEYVGSSIGLMSEFIGEGGPPGFFLECGTKIKCFFAIEAGTTSPFKFFGGAPASLDTGPVTLVPSGPRCPTSVIWLTEYPIANPSSLYVEE